MNLLLTLTFCLTLSITKAFLLPREVNLGKAMDEDPEKSYAHAKTALEELKIMITLVQAFESHPKFVDLVSLMKSKPVSEVIEIGLQPCSDTATMLLSKYC